VGRGVDVYDLVKRRMEAYPEMHRLIVRECSKALEDLEYVPPEY